MDSSLYLSFLFVSFGLIIIPGPNVLVIVTSSITQGKLRGLQTVAGTSLAMALQLMMVSLGTSWIIQRLTEGLSVLKWLGVAYLCWLGFMHIKRALGTAQSGGEVSAAATFSRGFLVSLSNPKTLLFFSAFLPQFISSTEHYFQQMVMLSVSFLLLAVVLDSCYALLSARLQPVLLNSRLSGLHDGLSGLLYLGASLWLATSRRVP